MLRKINLLGYLPQFIQEYEEIKEILKSEESEIDALNIETKRLLNNQYIAYCDTLGIRRFEKLLRIRACEGANLDERIAKVEAVWTDTIPYTYVYLLKRLDTLCGRNGYTSELLHNIYQLNVIISLPKRELQREVISMLKRGVPANIVINVNIDYRTWGEIKTTKWGDLSYNNCNWLALRENESRDVPGLNIFN